MKNFMSLGRCHGRSPSRPMTRLLLIAAIALINTVYLFICLPLTSHLIISLLNSLFNIRYSQFTSDILILPSFLLPLNWLFDIPYSYFTSHFLILPSLFLLHFSIGYSIFLILTSLLTSSFCLPYSYFFRT